MAAADQLDFFTTVSEVYYDVETQLSADEVGGWGNIHLMRVSIAISWSPGDLFRRWEEPRMGEFIAYLSKFRKIISFNGDGFDSRVLSFYGDVSEINRNSFDLLSDLKKKLGRRLRLDSLAQGTLGIGKSADGLAALRWWKEGKIDQIAAYCQQDVQVLIDLVAFARSHGYVSYPDLNTLRSVQVAW
jgi:DEAD/DEAH box helicase domain-containing protein